MAKRNKVNSHSTVHVSNTRPNLHVLLHSVPSVSKAAEGLFAKIKGSKRDTRSVPCHLKDRFQGDSKSRGKKMSTELTVRGKKKYKGRGGSKERKTGT